MNLTNRCLCLAVPLVLAGAAAQAVNFPTLTVQPEVVRPGINFSQSPTEITMMALSPTVTAAGALGDVDPAYNNNYTLRTDLVFDTNNPTELGLAARANASTLSLYELSLNPGGYLSLVKIAGGAGTGLAGSSIAYSSLTTYTLSLSVNGSALTGCLYDGATLIKKLEATDTSFTTGQIGIFAFIPTGGGPLLSGTWTNPSVTAVPEPAGLALLGLAGGLLAMRRRR